MLRWPTAVPPSLLQHAVLLQIESQPDTCAISPTDCLTPSRVTKISNYENVLSWIERFEHLEKEVLDIQQQGPLPQPPALTPNHISGVEQFTIADSLADN